MPIQEQFNCDCCGLPMKLEKDFGCKPRGKNKKKYRIRRFKCELCKIGKTIFADGEFDEKVIPQILQEKLKKISKQEKDARKTT